MHPDEAIQKIIDSLSSGDEGLQMLAIQEIRDSENIRFLTRAIEILQEDNEVAYKIAYVIIENLQRIESSKILPELEALLDQPSHSAWAIGMVARLDVDIAPKLLRFLAYPDDDVRYQALRVLESYSGIFEIALYLLNDASPKVRGKAVRILESLHNPIAIESLISKLSDVEIGVAGQFVAMDAIRALSKFDDERARKAIKKLVNSEIEELACSALDFLDTWDNDEEEIDFLLEQKNNKHRRIRILIMERLQHTPFVDSLSLIIDFAKNDRSYHVQKAAVELLKNSHNPEAKAVADHWYEHRWQENEPEY